MTEQVTTAWDQRFSSAARGMRFSAIRRMSALIEKPGIISFAPGQPSPDTFPVDAFRKILEDVLAREGASSFQYILTRGLAPLLAAIREYAAAKGIVAAATLTSAPPPPSGPPRRAWSGCDSAPRASTSITSARNTVRRRRRAAA